MGVRLPAEYQEVEYLESTGTQYIDTGIYFISNDIYKQERNSETIQNLIPCYRKSDDEPGMYDLVSKTFYTNQGTGEFLVGPDVVNHISPRLMDRRRALIAKLTSLFRKVITSQTGLVSFDTNVAKPMKVTCEFSPKQDLHGYDNPWPAGGGKNKWNPELPSNIDTANLTVTETNGVYTVQISGMISRFGNQPSIGEAYQTRFGTKQAVVAGSSMMFVVSDENVNAFRCSIYNSSDECIAIGTARNNEAFTVPENGVYLVAEVAMKSSLSSGTYTFTIMLVDSSTSYAPYENICPIEAWDGANVFGSGGNMICAPQDGWYQTFIPAGTLISASIEDNIQGRIDYYRKDKTQIDYWTLNIPSGNRYGRSFTVTEDTYFVKFTHGTNMVVRIGNNLYDYLPYATTLPIPFNNPGTYDFLPVQAGTGDPSPENVRPITPGLTFTRDDNTTLEIYGGSLTVNADGTGSLVSSKGDIRLNGASSENWQLAGNSTVFAYAVSGMENTRIPPLCNRFVLQNPYGNAYNVRVNVSDTSVTTVSDFKAWLANNELHVVYSLETPITYTLSVAETSRAFEALGLGKNLGPLYGGTVTVNEDGSADLDSRWVIRNLGQMNDIVKVGGSGVWEHRFDCRHYISGSGYDSGRRNGEPDDIMCSALKWGNAASNGTYLTYSSMITVYDDTVSSVAEFREKYADVQICYVGSDYVRQQYHFDNIGQLQSFLGTNNVWSDLNGPITVEYYKKQQ